MTCFVVASTVVSSPEFRHERNLSTGTTGEAIAKQPVHKLHPPRIVLVSDVTRSELGESTTCAGSNWKLGGRATKILKDVREAWIDFGAEGLCRKYGRERSNIQKKDKRNPPY